MDEKNLSSLNSCVERSCLTSRNCRAVLWLGLWRIEGTRSYLALQYWQSRKRWRETSGSDYYRTWYEEYRPILNRWNEIMVFEEEWAAEDLLATSDEA